MTIPRATAAIGLLAVLVGGCGGGGERLSGDEPPQSASRLRVSSPAFIDGARLRKEYTCDGAGEEPAVQATRVPAGTTELVLIVSDPDAPGGTFVHLTRFGLSSRGDGSLDHGSEGTNSTGKTGWTPPCPPHGDDPHRYVWTVYALGDASGLDAGADPDEVTAALDSVLASGGITARYGR